MTEQEKDQGSGSSPSAPLESHGGVPGHPAPYHRRVTSLVGVENQWDNHGAACKVTLDCGHHFYVTGRKMFNLYGADCKDCGGSGEAHYYHQDW